MTNSTDLSAGGWILLTLLPLLFSRSPFQHQLIRCPKMLCWFSKGCIWTSLTLWPFWPSGSFLDITPRYSKQSILSSSWNCQIQPSNKQWYCFPNCLCPIKIKSHSAYSLAIWSCLYWKAKINGNKINHGGSPQTYPWLGINLPYLSLGQGN